MVEEACLSSPLAGIIPHIAGTLVQRLRTQSDLQLRRLEKKVEVGDYGSMKETKRERMITKKSTAAVG